MERPVTATEKVTYPEIGDIISCPIAGGRGQSVVVLILAEGEWSPHPFLYERAFKCFHISGKWAGERRLLYLANKEKDVWKFVVKL